MEILVKITSQEIASASGEAMASLMGALQSIAQGTATAPAQVQSANVAQSPQKPAHETETADTGKNTAPAPKQAQTGAEKPQKAKPAEAPAPKAEPKKEEPEAASEPAAESEGKEGIPDRAAVRKRLADIRNEDESKAPKILEILHEFGVKKFSDLPDESLAEVLAKAEAL